eukprot:5360029-Pleurochrysis_carterae.AAC.1
MGRPWATRGHQRPPEASRRHQTHTHARARAPARYRYQSGQSRRAGYRSDRARPAKDHRPAKTRKSAAVIMCRYVYMPACVLGRLHVSDSCKVTHTQSPFRKVPSYSARAFAHAAALSLSLHTVLRAHEQAAACA